jgi:hypothetical protein
MEQMDRTHEIDLLRSDTTLDGAVLLVRKINFMEMV